MNLPSDDFNYYDIAKLIKGGILNYIKDDEKMKYLLGLLKICDPYNVYDDTINPTSLDIVYKVYVMSDDVKQATEILKNNNIFVSGAFTSGYSEKGKLVQYNDLSDILIYKQCLNRTLTILGKAMFSFTSPSKDFLRWQVDAFQKKEKVDIYQEYLDYCEVTYPGNQWKPRKSKDLFNV